MGSLAIPVSAGHREILKMDPVVCLTSSGHRMTGINKLFEYSQHWLHLAYHARLSLTRHSRALSSCDERSGDRRIHLTP